MTKNNVDTILSKYENSNNSYFDKLKVAKLCVFGAGTYGVSVASNLKKQGINISFFCDNDHKKTDGSFLHDGFSCISFEELLKVKDEVTVCIAMGAYKEVYKQLVDNGFENIFMAFEYKIRFIDFWKKNSITEFKKDINKVYNMLSDEKSRQVMEFCLNSWVEDVFSYDEIKSENQYFEDGLISIKHDEVFVDAGAYDGDTFDIFLDEAKNGFSKYIAFELNHKYAEKFREKLKNVDSDISEKVEIIEKGLSNVNMEITYTDDATSSRISNSDGTISGEIVRLDDALNERITFLKMDIEGAELDALESAKEHIKKYKPTLAICVYHNPKHLWEIPLYIKSLVPEYKLYLRHYTSVDAETVLYAVIED